MVKYTRKKGGAWPWSRTQSPLVSSPTQFSTPKIQKAPPSQESSNTVQSKSKWRKFWEKRGFLGERARKILTSEEKAATSAKVESAIGSAVALTSAGFLTQACFAGLVATVGIGAVGATAGAVIPVIGAVAFVAGFVSERIIKVENLKLTMGIIMDESNRMLKVYDNMITTADLNGVDLKINTKVFIQNLKELIVYMLSMTSDSEQAVSEKLLGRKNMGINNSRVGVFKRLTTYLNPGEFMNILMDKLTRVTSSFIIVYAEYNMYMSSKTDYGSNTTGEPMIGGQSFTNRGPYLLENQEQINAVIGEILTIITRDGDTVEGTESAIKGVLAMAASVGNDNDANLVASST